MSRRLGVDVIELYRSEDGSDLADRTEATLRRLVVGHTVHIVADPADVPVDDLPVIREGDRIVPTAEIPRYLEELRRFMADWTRFQSDACYIGDDGSVC